MDEGPDSGLIAINLDYHYHYLTVSISPDLREFHATQGLFLTREEMN